jgi:hypothetical protein
VVGAWIWLRGEGHRLSAFSRRAWKGPGGERTAVVQAVKAGGAATAAWALSGWWLAAPFALLAPWTALLLVRSTVYRSVRSGLQQMCVIGAGTAVGAVTLNCTHSTLGSMVLALPLMMLIGAHPRFGDQGSAGATTALLVIVSGSGSGATVTHRLLEVGIGAAIGIAVNALILPPVHQNTTLWYARRLPRENADLLADIAETLRGDWTSGDAQRWQEQVRRLRGTVDAFEEARQWNSESLRLNPGRRLRRRVRSGSVPALNWHSVATHLQAITRTLLHASGEQAQLVRPSAAFFQRYADLLSAVGRTCAACCDTDTAATPYGGGGEPQARTPRPSAQAWEIHRQLYAERVERQEGAAAVGLLLVEADQLLWELGPAGT